MRTFAKRHSFFFVAGAMALAHTGHAHTDPAAVDPSWGGTGTVTSDIDGTNQDDAATAILPQPDGRVVVVGTILRPLAVGGAVRYDESGHLDTSFGNGGRVVLPETVLPDGTRCMGNMATAATLQADGKIVFASQCRVADLYWHPYLNLLRINSDGTLDTSFGGTGNLKLAMGALGAGHDSLSYSPSAMTTTPDGKIAVLFGYQPRHYSDPYSYALVRLHPDGTPDRTLGGNGIAFFGLDSYSRLAVQQDGKMVLAGARDKEAVIARLNVDGTFDSSFGSNGQLRFDAPQLEYGTSGSYTRIEGLALQSDGRILATGRLSSATNAYSDDALVVRVTVNGTLDGTFGGNGIVATDIGGETNAGKAIALQQDGRIVVSGSAVVQEPGNAGARVSKTAVLRYNRNGSLDRRWNCSGYALYDAGYNVDMAIDRSGRILLGGSTSSAPADLVTVRLRGTPTAHPGD